MDVWLKKMREEWNGKERKKEKIKKKLSISILMFFGLT